MPVKPKFLIRLMLVMAMLALAGLCFAAMAGAVSDLTAPAIHGVQPPDGGTIYSGSAVVSAYYADEPGGSGIDPSSAMIHLDGRMLFSGCAATESMVSCPKSGLAYGAHHLEIFIMDNAGNEAVSATTFNVGDNIAPAVTFTGTDPAKNGSWIANPDHDVIVLGTAIDSAPSSGIASASATIGGVPFPCTIDASGNLSCQTTGLTDGHKSVTLSVTDNDGNKGTATGSFMLSNHCTGAKADLSLGMSQIFWASYADYEARTLSITYMVQNHSSDLSTSHTKMTSSEATNGVIVLTTMPKSIGTVLAGSSKSVTVQYAVPVGVAGFRVTNTAWGEDGCGQYTYP